MGKQRKHQNPQPDTTLQSQTKGKNPPDFHLKENTGPGTGGGSFATQQARLMMLLNRATDHGQLMQYINQQRMFWANTMSQLMTAAANLSPDSEEFRALEARRAQIAQIDKMLEMEAQRIENQRQAVTVEIEAIRSLIENNIGASFEMMN